MKLKTRKKLKKTRLQVVSAHSLPFETMWMELRTTANIVSSEKKHPGDEVTAKTILALMSLIEGKYNEKRKG